MFPLSEAVCFDLVHQHGPMVKAVCQRILRDAGLAEDASQEVFLLLVRKLPWLPPQTVLGGWLYVTACHVAQTHVRAQIRRCQRENRPEAVDYLMKAGQDTHWCELEPMLDEAMLTLSQRQRQLVLSRYFQGNSSRAAASLVGCSESVASRELASAIERLRGFFSRRGIRVSGAVLVSLMSTHGTQAYIATQALAATLASASALSGTSGLASPFLITLMQTTTTTKIIAASAALLITVGTVRHFTRPNGSNPPANQVLTSGTAPVAVRARTIPSVPLGKEAGKPFSQPGALADPLTERQLPHVVYDEAALTAAQDKHEKFLQRMGELVLMGDPTRVQKILQNEYGIQLSAEEIRGLQARGEKGFTAGIVELWSTRQPQEALTWGVSAYTSAIGTGVDLQQQLLEGARRALPGLSRDSFNAMVSDGPGKGKMLDLLEAATEPASLANRILTDPDPTERGNRLRLLAQGWSDPEASAAWARENLSGEDKMAYYSQVGYELAHRNPQTALQILSELNGTEAYASTFGSMMRGLVQEGGRGPEVAALIANANLSPEQRGGLISELARRWVRNDADAAVEWVNTLTAPEDFRAAIPLLVSQLDNDRVGRTVEAYLKNNDPIMEEALIEAAAPSSLRFDPEKSRLILDPLISRDPSLKLIAAEGASREAMLWNSVNQTAKRQAEDGSPAAAMQWLAKIPFANQSDFARAIGNVMNVWNLKSPTEANAWLQSSSLNPALRSEVLKLARP
jgi:RNA polymerase sigma factor (sigma-70 family)